MENISGLTQTVWVGTLMDSLVMQFDLSWITFVPHVSEAVPFVINFSKNASHWPGQDKKDCVTTSPSIVYREEWEVRL